MQHRKNKLFFTLIIALMTPILSEAGTTSTPTMALTSAQIQEQSYSLVTRLRETRLQARVDLKSVSASLAGFELVNTQLRPNYASPGSPPGHYLFLVDTSITMRGKPLKQALALIGQLISTLPDNTLYSIASFDKQLKIWVEAEAKQDFDTTVLEGMAATGKVTELYRLVLEAMKNLVATDSAQPTVVILSDGRVEDTNYSDRDVIEYAQKEQIVLHGLAFNYTAEAQSLRRLSEATGGVFTEVDPQGKIDDDALIYLRHSAVNGGEALFDLQPYEGRWGTTAELRVTYTFENGFTTTATEQITLPSRPWLEIPFRGYPRLWWIAGLSGALFLLILLLIAGLRRRRKTTEPDPPADPCQACGKHICPDWTQCHHCGSPLGKSEALAQLTTVDSTMTRTFPITKTLTSIGRLDDNDIALDDDTVSRRQANITYKDGMFFIHDLGSVNTTRCNGQEITASTQLHHGDEIEVGETKLRFEENTPACNPNDPLTLHEPSEFTPQLSPGKQGDQ